VVQSLGLIADAAGELDGLLAGALAAWDVSLSVEPSSLSQSDGLVKRRELGLGEVVLGADPLAKLAEDSGPMLVCSQRVTEIDERGWDFNSLLRDGGSGQAGGELAMLHANPILQSHSRPLVALVIEVRIWRHCAGWRWRWL
jgi:hypothetical protein